MELRQLEYFCAVSSLESFTKAANFLHVSQPSVTKTVQSLETELNLELFDRSQKHISLTEAGNVFFIHAKKILQDVQTSKSALERFQNKSGGAIKFGVPPTAESYLFPNFFIKFKEANPKIFIDLQECCDSNSVQEKIEKNELDFGIIFLPEDKQLKNSLKLFEDEFFLCVSSNHKFAKKKKISFADLKNEKFILQPSGTIQNFMTIQGSANAGFAPKIFLSVSPLKTIKELVSEGDAVALIPHFAIKKSAKFKSIPLTPPIKFKVALTWNGLKELSPLSLHFLNFADNLFHEKNFAK